MTPTDEDRRGLTDRDASVNATFEDLGVDRCNGLQLLPSHGVRDVRVVRIGPDRDGIARGIHALGVSAPVGESDTWNTKVDSLAHRPGWRA